MHRRWQMLHYFFRGAPAIMHIIEQLFVNVLILIACKFSEYKGAFFTVFYREAESFRHHLPCLHEFFINRSDDDRQSEHGRFEDIVDTAFLETPADKSDLSICIERRQHADIVDDQDACVLYAFAM